MFQVSHLSVHYGSHHVVRDVNLSLGEDEILMLVGPTGCGKTTILQALAGLVPISAGSIQVGDWCATPKDSVAPEKRNVGMVFQDFALFPHLSVEQNVQFRLSDPAPADFWLDLLGLNDYRTAKPARLSGGQKQRVALARTLAHRPAYVLLDEPLSNLDAALKDSLRWDIRNALKQANVPAVWVTHDQNEALSVGDTVGVLRAGEIQQLASPQDCFDRPSSRFVANFLGDASFLPGKLARTSVSTELGTAPALPMQGAKDTVALLLRPDDISATPMAEGNGVVDWVRYEGGSRLLAVTTRDTGTQVKTRVSHEQLVKPGDRVHLNITTTHPLAVYPA